MPNWSDDEGRCHFDVNGVPCYQSDVGCPMHGGANLMKRPRKRREKRYTRAEALAFGEKVKEACDLAARLHPGNPMRGVRAVDVALLLDKEKNNE